MLKTVKTPRNLSLSRLKRSPMNGDAMTEDRSNKRARTSSADDRKNNPFLEACMQVSCEGVQNFRKRFQLLYLPECKDRKCAHDVKDANIQPVSAIVQENFKIEVKNKTWYEALEVCLLTITPSQYLTAHMMKGIMEIILNTQDNPNDAYTSDYILRKCQQTLSLQFTTHPPCVIKKVRDCYKNFLTSPMDHEEIMYTNRKQFCSDEGIVTHCIARLLHEISSDSRDDKLIDIEVPKDLEGVKLLDWQKENLELFELLERSERIERLMLIMEIVIDLLQTDLSLCNSRCGINNQMRSGQPLINYIVRRERKLDNGKIPDQCYKILELFVHFVHLQYPEEYINVMGLWANTMIQMFYIDEYYNNMDYPNLSIVRLHKVSQAFNHIISSLPKTSVVKVLERIQPAFMQYLVGKEYIHTLHDVKNDIIKFIISLFDNEILKKYNNRDSVITLPKMELKRKVKTKSLNHKLSKICKDFIPNTTAHDENTNDNINILPKLEKKKCSHKLQRNEFVNILFTTFVAYLECYSIKKFKQTYLELQNKTQSIKEQDETSNKNFKVSTEFVNRYRAIVQSLKELSEILKTKDDDFSKNLLILLNTYIS